MIKVFRQINKVFRYTNNREYLTFNRYFHGAQFWLYGGNDYLSVHADASTINAGTGNDQVYLTGAYNWIAMHDGNDVFALRAGNDNNIHLGAGNDRAEINGSRNTITGGSGDDALTVRGNNNTINFGEDNDVIGVLGDNNVLKDNPRSHRQGKISVQGNGNLIDSSYNNNITVFHDGKAGWNETTIRGWANYVSIDTSTIKQSSAPHVFTHATSVQVYGGRENDIGLTMQEGRKVNLGIRTMWANVDMNFGTAGANNYFEPFSFSLQVYSGSNVNLSIIAPNAKVERLQNFDNNDIRYGLWTDNDARQPHGFINLSQMDGVLHILLNNEKVITHG